MPGRFPPQWLDELRERADIVQVIGSYVALKKNGHRYVGLCPFHNETAPSFSVDEQKQLFHCFGCKAGGTVIQFVMDIEHLDFQEAVKFLADRVHMPLPEMQNDPGYEMRRTLKERIYLANKAAAQMYHNLLWQPESAHILEYLQKKRGLDDSVIRRFGIGAAPPSGRVGRALMEQGFSEEELIQAGLMMKKDDRPAFDMFRNRALFPIIDSYGNVLGFGGRAMGDAMPKYLNTGDTPAFNKRLNVFAANLLRREKNLQRVILVEGYMDVAALSQFGVTGVAATLGTALTVEQAKLLKRFAPEVYLSYDGDGAGQKAILRGLDVLEEAGVPCRVLDLPGGQDPDEYIREHGLDSFSAIKPISGTQYRMLREKEKHDLSTEEGRTEYAKACSVFLRKVREPVELENHLKRLSLETGFEREVLYRQVGVTPVAEKPAAPEFRRKARSAGQEQSGTGNRASAILLAIMATGKLPVKDISPDLFEEGIHRSFAEHLLSGSDIASFMESLPDEQSRTVLSEILDAIPAEDDATLLKMARESMETLRRQALQKEMENSADTLSLEQALLFSRKLSNYNESSDH